MKKLFLTLMTLTSVMAFGKGYKPTKKYSAAVVAPAPVAPVAPVASAPKNVNPLVTMIQAALSKVAQGAQSPEAVRLQTLNDAVTALSKGLAGIVVTDLAPSDKALLTEACSLMVKEAQSLLTLNTAGDWMPYFIKSPKSSVLKLQELLKEIYAMDEVINGRTVTTLFKQYVYRPVMNNKMKSAMVLAGLLTANKLGILDLGWEGTKFSLKQGFNFGCWLVAGPKVNLKDAIAAQVVKNKAARA